jgi:hypothetical protein
MPRRVNYCPYCGAAQEDVTAHPISPVVPAQEDATARRSTVAVPAPADLTAHPNTVIPAKAGIHTTPPGGAQPTFAKHHIEVPTSAPSSTPPSSHEWGASGRPQAPAAAPPLATPALPPQREPVRLRWWLLALALLWAVWYTAKPTSKKIDERIDRAISLATECKPREAQSELIALRRDKAAAAQLQRVQDALNEAAAECRRLRKRGRALSDAGASAAVPSGAADGVERPRTRSGRQGTTRAHPNANGEP